MVCFAVSLCSALLLSSGSVCVVVEYLKIGVVDSDSNVLISAMALRYLMLYSCSLEIVASFCAIWCWKIVMVCLLSLVRSSRVGLR